MTRDAGSAVDQDEDHATKGPGDAEEANTITRASLLLVAYDSGDGDVEEQESGDELGDHSPVEGPALELVHVDQRGRWGVHVVLSMVLDVAMSMPFLAHFLRHLLFLQGTERLPLCCVV